MKKRWLYLILPAITLILEILPYGAVCNFMRPAATEGAPAGQFRELYSYFDLLPFGYANVAPLLTAVVSCVVFLLLILYGIINRYNVVRIAKAVLSVAVVLSLCPLLLGIHYFSVVGALITLSLIGELLLLQFTIKKDI